MARLILIPAAGEGSRFRKAGISTPKPLIRVQGLSLLEHTLASFQLKAGDDLLLAVRRQHGVREQLEASILSRHPGVALHWVELDTLLPGQLATSQVAIAELLQHQPDLSARPLLIHNCDTGFQWNASLGRISGFASMAVFQADGDHWSFGLPDPTNPERALAIAEKERISDLASIGLYGFRSTSAFLDAALTQLRQGTTVRGEHYIAPMLQIAISAGESVALPRVEGVRLYGTPEELLRTFAISLDSLRQQG